MNASQAQKHFAADVLAMEIRRHGRVFRWQSIPRQNATPELALFDVENPAHWLCKIVPQTHGITFASYFEVYTAKANDALFERGATFHKLSEAVAWCSANDWLKEATAVAQPPQLQAQPAPAPAPVAPSNGHASNEVVDVAAPEQSKPAPKPFKPGNDVNHPSHYNMGSVEVIDALEAWNVEPHEFNVIKYVARAEHKGNRIGDLEKALWYLDRKINLLRGVMPYEPTAAEIEDAISNNPPGIYQHYKGGYYRLMEIAFHHETRLPLAVYVPVNDDHSAKPDAEISVRPLFPSRHDADAWTTHRTLRDGTRSRFKLVKSAVMQS